MLSLGDRFWIDPKQTGLGKRYWFVIVEVTYYGYRLKIDGEVK